MAEVRGIDVSAMQGRIDWPAVAASGIRFAYVRAFEGQTPDPAFARNRQEALAAGLLVGSYQYLRARHPGRYQADLLLDALGPLAPGELPPALDCEDLDGQDRLQVQAAILAWVYRMTAALGRPPVLYAGPGWWLGELHGEHLSELAGCPLWCAAYGVSKPPLFAPWQRVTLWQKAGDGRCPGVSGPVDLDVADEHALGALAVPAARDTVPAPETVPGATAAEALAEWTTGQALDDSLSETGRRGRE